MRTEGTENGGSRRGRCGWLQLILASQFTRGLDTGSSVTQSSPLSSIWRTQLGLGQALCWMLGAHWDLTLSTGKIHGSKLFLSPRPIPCHSPNLPSPSSRALGLAGPLPTLPLTQMEIRQTAKQINPTCECTPKHTQAHVYSPPTLAEHT